MTDRVRRELALVGAIYGDLDVSESFTWFMIKRWKLVPGWSKKYTRVLVLVPSGYAVTPPDNFYTDVDLTVNSGTKPGSTSVAHPISGQQWLQFSYHVEVSDWQPENGHDLLTFLAGVDRRLKEVN